MKLNIEELAKQADELADIVFNGNPHSANEWHKERDKAFARLIVERCAHECEQTEDGEGPDCWDWHSKDYAKAIRNLMED